MKKESKRLLGFLVGVVLGFLVGNYFGLFGGILGDFGVPYSQVRLKVAVQDAVIFGLVGWVLAYVATKE